MFDECRYLYDLPLLNSSEIISDSVVECIQAFKTPLVTRKKPYPLTFCMHDQAPETFALTRDHLDSTRNVHNTQLQNKNNIDFKYLPAFFKIILKIKKESID